MQPVDWHAFLVNLFELGASNLSVSVLEKIVRPIAVYLVLVFALKKVGKRILAQLNPFDLVVLLTLSNTVQNAIIGNDTSLVGGVIGAVALLAMNALLVHFYYRGPSMEHRYLEEEDVYLIQAHRGTIYMKGASQDSARINEVLQQLQALRREVAALRQ